MAASVLLIDSDLSVIQRIQPALTQKGHQVSYALPGPDAIQAATSAGVNLVILGMSSCEEDWLFCRRLLRLIRAPLLLLLASDDELDRVRALDLGADDCLLKPARLVEVIARARALLRRGAQAGSRPRPDFFVDDNLVVDLTRREVLIDDEPVALTPTEFRLLACFIRHVGEILSHDQISLQLWGPNRQGDRASLKQYIHHLRRKLELDPSRPRRIVTQWGEGYLFRPVATKPSSDMSG